MGTGEDENRSLGSRNPRAPRGVTPGTRGASTWGRALPQSRRETADHSDRRWDLTRPPTGARRGPPGESGRRTPALRLAGTRRPTPGFLASSPRPGSRASRCRTQRKGPPRHEREGIRREKEPCPALRCSGTTSRFAPPRRLCPTTHHERRAFDAPEEVARERVGTFAGSNLDGHRGFSGAVQGPGRDPDGSIVRGAQWFQPARCKQPEEAEITVARDLIGKPGGPLHFECSPFRGPFAGPLACDPSLWLVAVHDCLPIDPKGDLGDVGPHRLQFHREGDGHLGAGAEERVGQFAGGTEARQKLATERHRIGRRLGDEVFARTLQAICKFFS